MCGEVHRLRIHVVVARKIRTEEERNTAVLIAAIYCGRARRRGGQYTKRMLPSFVIPRCTITLENVLRYVLGHPEEGAIDYDEASYLLGSYDNRTIRKHIRCAWGMLRTAREELSNGSAEGPMPEGQRVPIAPQQACTAKDCPAGQPAEAGELIVVLHALYVRFGAGIRRADSTLSRACGAPAGCDTS